MPYPRFLCSAAALLLAGGTALADEPPGGEQSIDLSALIGAMGGGMPTPSAAAGALPDFNQVTKDMESTKGLFTLWYYPPPARDKDPEKLLCQIPASFLGEKFMLSTSMAGGGFFTGFPLDERVVQWELLGNQLLLVEPETRFVVKRSESVADVVERTYPDRIRAAVPLVTKSPAGDPVIDLGKLLKSDFADIGWMSFFGGGMPTGGINPTLSKWTKKKAFELNVEIGVELALSRMHPPGSYDKKMVHYSFWKLPASDYKPRIADDRIGYFLTANQDWSKPTDARDLFNRYIDRWHLVKRDPSLPLCEPKQPIIFYIEKTVPVRFRRAVRDGILEWNEAFEQVGFSNAVVVRQQTDDNEWKDLDPEDMRYSFFRWIVTGAGFAMGPHRANPFTGQIYDADIIFDDSMVRYFEQSAERLLPETMVAMKLDDPVLDAFLEANPQWQVPKRPWEGFRFDRGEDEQVRAAMKQRMYRQGRHFCEYAEGMKHQMMFASTVLADQRQEVVNDFLYDVIKEVVMHEVGHTLGLRHNFKASSIWTFEEIKERREAGEATTGSVMDYNPVLFFADGSTEGNFLTPTIGPYDHWAIEYGYRPFDGTYKSAKKEQEDEVSDESSEETEADEVMDQAAASPPPSVSMTMTYDDLPPEILSQIPEEYRAQVKQMMESGAMKQMMEAAVQGGMPTPATPPKRSGPSFKAPVAGEKAMLLDIAARSTEPHLAYATDEDTTILSPDPRTWRFDAAQDPIAWATDRMALVDKRMDNLLEWSVNDAESWYYATGAFITLMIEKTFVMDYVGRYVGGQYFNRAHKGEPGAEAPFVLVEPQVQRQALDYIQANLYDDEFFEVRAEILNHLAPPRWWHQGAYVSYAMDFPMHSLVELLQWWNLFDRMYPNTLRRIHDAELKTDASDKITAAEYILAVQGGVWGPTTGVSKFHVKPLVSDTRRSLQRVYLSLAEPMVRTPPGRVLPADLHAMMRQSLRDLSKQIGEVLSNGTTIDFASRAHLEECRSRIDRMLEAPLDEYGY